jgi:hypothetical protein
MGVDSSSTPFENPASGYIGLGPYTTDISKKATNFMNQLKSEGKITHNVVSIYTSM